MAGKGVFLSLFIGATPLVCFAQIANPGFETNPAFTGWSTTGDAQIEGASLGSGPVEGVQQALLASATDGTVNSDVKAGSGVGGNALDSSLGLSAGSLRGLETVSGSPVATLLGSKVSQTLSLQAGDKITFSWDFLTNQLYNDGTANSYKPDVNNPDFAFAGLIGTGGAPTTLLKLVDVFDGYGTDGSAAGFHTALTVTPLSDPFDEETGFRTTTFTVTQAGTYTLGVGVAHAVSAAGPDNGINSALLVDAFQYKAVPEPCSLAAIGAAAVALLRRRRQAR